MSTLWRRGALSLVAVFVVTAVACDPCIGFTRTAAGMTQGGSIVGYVDMPSSFSVVGIGLIQVKGGIIGDSDDPHLWEVRASVGQRVTEFTVGITPGRFHVATPLGGLPPSDTELGFVITLNDGTHDYAQFHIKDLRPGRVWYMGKSTTVEDFRKRAEAGCLS